MQNKLTDQSKQVELLEKIHSAYNESIVEMKKQLEQGRNEMCHLNNY